VKVNIVSGYSNQGGSTESFIHLTNALNDRGHDVTFYGPNAWHMGRCKSALLSASTIDYQLDKLNTGDCTILHNLPMANFVSKLPNVIVSVHEWPTERHLQYKDYKHHFVSKHQEAEFDHVCFQNKVTKPHTFISPPIMSHVTLSEAVKRKDRVAGVVGLVYPHKQTCDAIMAALMGKHHKVLVYGKVTDEKYFKEGVKPLLGGAVEYMGHINDKQKIYDSITDLYLYSRSETYSLVAHEAHQAGVRVHLPSWLSYITPEEIIPNNDIIQQWEDEIVRF